MTSDPFETLTCEQASPHVLVVHLNRPAAANALDTQMGRDLHALFSGLIFDAGALRCVILTGAGRHFCAGGDLKERDGMSPQAWRRQHAIFEQAFAAVMDCPIPVIAAVNGAAYGGGCELALACDFIYAADNARFGLVETGLGIIPGGGGTQNLPRAVGIRRARELVLSSAAFTAAEAEAWGMVNRLYATDELRGAALAMAERIAANAPIAVRQAKQAMRIGSETDLKTGLAIEIEAYNRTVDTRDRHEGISAAAARRMPVFIGE